MTQRFSIKRQADGRAYLNLGSSARVAVGWTNVDSSWLLRLARWPWISSILHAMGLVSESRYERIRRLDSDAICWDLRKGIPFPDEVFDVVYHSHVLEHIEHAAASSFLLECHRVLKPGGIIRVVVPDLERLARRYVSILDGIKDGGVDAGGVDAGYEAVINDIFEQMVRRVPKARSERPLAVRLLEAVLIGDTDRSGERHRWMYDRFSLARLLSDVGFSQVAVLNEKTSRIDGWTAFSLDVEADSTPYKPDSLYIEAQRLPAREAGAVLEAQ